MNIMTMENYTLTNKINDFLPYLNERQKRIYLASESKQLGHGGIGVVAKISGMNRNTIARGKTELENQNNAKEGLTEEIIAEEASTVKTRIRKPGGGRKPIEESQPGIKENLLSIVDEYSYGNPINPLSWTTKSLRHLSEALGKEGYKISFKKVGQLLEEMGFSLQQNQKKLQVGNQHLDRNLQFKYINDCALQFIQNDNPVISINCKKIENIGLFKNGGSEYSEKGNTMVVNTQDFMSAELGKAVPYGVYDIATNEGCVNVGISPDTEEFAVMSIKQWWKTMGKNRYPNSYCIYIIVDGGGSNGSTNKLWKSELQKFANDTNLEISVSHFPPGTSKWNKIEHLMFSHITKYWRGLPLETIDVIINLIALTTTKTGLNIKCGLDKGEYKTGINISSNEEYVKINLDRNGICGSWNYTIIPL